LDRVLVTGGAGCIGSHVVDRLVGLGCSVVVFDDLSSGRFSSLEGHLASGRVRFYMGDIRDWALVSKAVRDVDAVVHLAAVISVPFSVKHPVRTNDVNVNGTLNLLWACCGAENVKRFVFSSSCAVYGEACYVPVDEGHPVQPLSPYAASKVAGEAYCNVFWKAYGLETVVLRIFNVYGPRQLVNDYSGVIVKFMDAMRGDGRLTVYGDGEQTRDFVFVDDVVDAVLLALENEDAAGETFNIGSGKATSVNLLAETVSEVFGAEAQVAYEEPRPGDIRHSVASIAKAERLLGYRPKVDLEQGLRKLLSSGNG